MCSLVIKKDYNKEIQSQQSSHIGHIGYARNKRLALTRRDLGINRSEGLRQVVS